MHLFGIGKDNNALETNRIDGPMGQQQHAQPAPPPQRTKPDDGNNALVLRSHEMSSAAVGPTATTASVAKSMADAAAVTVTAVIATGDADTASTSSKRGDAPEELVPAHGAFFFALGCGSALIVTLVAVTSALAYKRTNKSLLRSKSKESLQ
jgi:hypothetical protein